MTGLNFDALGLAPSPATRIVVAMSGGVDSSVTAALLHEAGFDVVGVTLQLYDYGTTVGKKGACCAGQDIYDASEVAGRFGFPHYVLDYESVFKQAVIDDFADSYLRGETPIPCVRCNQRVKFQDLFKMARQLGGQALATGHYVQRKPALPFAELHRAQDPQKDQSYFLFTTTQDQVDYLRFPLGHMTKAQTRAHAHRLGLGVSDKPDSQDICFVPNKNYASVVARLRPGALEKGNIVDEQGTILGTHEGVIHFTIGQRKGLNLSHNPAQGNPLYVVALEPETHTVVVGPQESLACLWMTLKEVNWLCASAILQEGQSIQVKIRSSQTPLPATLYPHEDPCKAMVRLDQPEYGIARGQACVFYDQSRVLGGGWIEETSKSSDISPTDMPKSK